MLESTLMKTLMRGSFARLATAAVIAAAALVAPAIAAAEEGEGMAQAQANPADIASLQRGARLYFNYCSGCHSIKYMSYARLADDLRLSTDDVLKSFAFTGAKIGDQVMSNMPADSSQQWFGKTPPDLSLEARAKGPDWIFNYLRSFYVDPTATVGWNNTVFPNASMPNPLWELQGVQTAERSAAKPGEEARVEKLHVTTKGKLNATEFDDAARDVTAFLQYVGEPAALQRYAVGVWVVLFLAFFTFLAYLLKHEYWKDVH
jgi:ubiquinol-cytochrome c reductase cytochrome c1 subunit